jgi:hypothetical protein
MNKQSGSIWDIILFIFIIGFCLFLYTLLHETGHAIFAILSGAGIKEFVIIDIRPHVSIPARSAVYLVVLLISQDLPFL